MQKFALFTIVTVMALTSAANAEWIAGTGFEEAQLLSDGTTYHHRGVGSHYLQNYAGDLAVRFDGSATELGIESYFEGDEAGRDASGDYIGVCDYYNNTGNGSYENEQNMGTITLEIETVDVSDYADVELSYAFKFLYDVAESTEGIQIWVENEVGTQLMLADWMGADWTTAHDTYGQYAWNNFTFDIPDDWQSASLRFAMTSYSYQVGYQLDDINFNGTYVPEPASAILLALGALTLIRRR